MPALFSADELTAFTGGSWLNGRSPAGSISISTDTRCDNHGRIFFALAGERFDAHDFIDRAVDSGCEAVCINRSRSSMPLPENIPVLTVDDTLRAMQACAAAHRRRFSDLTAWGVTGSVGKTSVKEMLRAICSHIAGEENILCTEGNTNNQVGVVQNLLKLTERHRFAVLEAGTSSHGEIAPLGQMISPFAAIVNSIAPCHLENLIDLDGVAREKSAIFTALPANGIAVFPAGVHGENILRSAAAGRQCVTFGMDGKGDVSARFISGELAGSTFELRFPDGTCRRISWELTGVHNALNAAGAAALAFACGISPEMIAQALPNTRLPGMRMKKTILDDIVFYNDAYNANPASMKASLTMLSEAGLSGRLILVFGGMRELGTMTAEAHRDLLKTAAELLPNAEIITVGKEFEGLSGCNFADSESAGKYLQTILQKNDTVFAKGSRFYAVEKSLPPEAR